MSTQNEQASVVEKVAEEMREFYDAEMAPDDELLKSWIDRLAAPVTAAPVTVTRDADGEIVMVKQGDNIIASTCHAGGKAPAAPEIDLEAIKGAEDFIARHSYAWNGEGVHPNTVIAGLRALIDASTPAAQEAAGVDAYDDALDQLWKLAGGNDHPVYKRFLDFRDSFAAALRIDLTVLADRITDHLCEHEYDIGGRDELLRHVREAIDVNHQDDSIAIKQLLPPNVWPQWADRHVWDANGQGWFYGAFIDGDGEGLEWNPELQQSGIAMPPEHDWRNPVFRSKTNTSIAISKDGDAQQAGAQAIAIVHMDGYRWNGQHWQKNSPKGGSEAQDAARYRFLREVANHDPDDVIAVTIQKQDSWGNWRNVHLHGHELDAATDAAMQATSPVRKTSTCGGCGNTDPSKRCLGCLHDFV